jgi:hypothetical protein
MIEIKLAVPQKIDEICLSLKIEHTQGLQVYVACEKGEELGSCGFEMLSGVGTLLFTSMSSANLALIEDGLIRSTLALMFESGVEDVTCGVGVDPKMLKRLGFKEKDGVYALSLSHSFLTQVC